MSFPFVAALAWRATVNEYVGTKTFRRGQLGMTEDGSLWRLCKAEAALTNATRAVINGYEHLSGVSGDSAESALVNAIVAGDVDYTMTDATNARAKDYFKDGYSIQPRGAGDNIRHIWKSDAEVSDTYKIYVSAPFTLADGVGNTIHTYPSPWGNVIMPTTSPTGGAGFEHFVGVQAFAPVTSGYYFWNHVRGPHWLTVGTGVWPGAASEDRSVHFHTNGTVDMLDRGIHSATSPQLAGYLMFSGNYGDVLIHLQVE